MSGIIALAPVQAHKECSLFSVQLKALEASTSELEVLHQRRLETSQKDAAAASARIDELLLLNEALSKRLQTSADEHSQADAASAKVSPSAHLLPLQLLLCIVAFLILRDYVDGTTWIVS